MNLTSANPYIITIGKIIDSDGRHIGNIVQDGELIFIFSENSDSIRYFPEEFSRFLWESRDFDWEMEYTHDKGVRNAKVFFTIHSEPNNNNVLIVYPSTQEDVPTWMIKTIGKLDETKLSKDSLQYMMKEAGVKV